MHKWLALVLVACTGVSAWAQSGPVPPEQERDLQLSRQQKRLELRAAVLSANRREEGAEQLSDATPVEHQMTVKERAELREQLRQYHPVSPRPRP